MKNIVRGLALLTCIVAVGAGTSALADFDYDDFSTTDGLILVQDAAFVDDMVRLTPANFSQRGAVWYESREVLARGFTTTFSFQLMDQGPTIGADGLAFVIQGLGNNVIGGLGGGMGYDGLSPSLVVEFDTWYNSINGEPDGNHVSVQYNGTVFHGFSLSETSFVPFMTDERIHTARIVYQPGDFKVYLDNFDNPVIELAINLESYVPLVGGGAFIGFTAATGAEYETHDLLAWEFEGAKYPFEEFRISRLDLEFEDDLFLDAFTFNGQFLINPLSDGIDILTEDIRLEIGPSKLMIPAGSFALHDQRYTWSGTIGDTYLVAEFRDLGEGSYKFEFKAEDADLTGCANPEKWRLVIGDDAGLHEERLEGKLKMRPVVN